MPKSSQYSRQPLLRGYALSVQPPVHMDTVWPAAICVPTDALISRMEASLAVTLLEMVASTAARAVSVSSRRSSAREAIVAATEADMAAVVEAAATTEADIAAIVCVFLVVWTRRSCGGHREQSCVRACVSANFGLTLITRTI